MINLKCVVRTAEETEEYERVTKSVGRGLTVIQEELHRMRMATKAQVDNLALQREVSSQQHDMLPATRFSVFNFAVLQNEMIDLTSLGDQIS